MAIVAILWMATSDYSINGYWWLLVINLLMVIGGYSINAYWWFFY
jgi:hypothetical protein